MESVVWKSCFHAGDDIPGYPFPKPPFRRIDPVRLATCFNNLRVLPSIGCDFVMPMDDASKQFWIESPPIFRVVCEAEGLRWLEIRQFAIGPEADIVVHHRGFYRSFSVT